MRVSSSQTANMLINCLQSSYSQYATVAEQLSTGEKLTSPSDDAVTYVRLQSLSSQQTSLTQYQDNIETAESRLSESETQFDSMTDALSELRSLVVSAGNGTYDSDDISDLTEQMQSLLDTIVDLGNATDSSGDYLFSGSDASTAPITVNDDGTYTYNGDDYQISVAVSDGVTVKSSDTLSDIFFSDDSNFLNDISSMITSLTTTDDTSSVIDSMLDTIDSTASKLSSTVASIGNRTNQLDDLNEAHEETLLYSENLSSELGDADYSTASIKSEEILTSIEATQSVISKVLGLSLFDDI
jgi:flagellar hook-associated protein 3 FlgL